MLPNLIIIGAQKCGTTSLHYYLGLHPQIAMSKEKELKFFIEERNWSRGLEWYKSQFGGKAKIFGESSPGYTNYPRFVGVPSRMKAIVPDAKLIYIVRDPIGRMISNYIHNYSDGLENRSIEEALGATDNNFYLSRSMYHMQLEQYLAYYSSSQILMIAAEDLREHRQSTLKQVFKFLEVDPEFHSLRFKITRHSTSFKRRKTDIGRHLSKTNPMKLLQRFPQRLRWPIEDAFYVPFSRKIERPKISEPLRRALIELLRDDVSRLRALTGKKFEKWSI